MAATDASPRATAARGSGTAIHALVRTGGHLIAIPSEYVTQAVEAPPELAQMPRRANAIDGMMTLGRRVIPVVSLTRWLEPAVAAGDRSDDRSGDVTPDRAHGLVLLLEADDACIGLAVDAVVGAQRIRADQVRRLFHDDDPDELFQSAALFGADTLPTSIIEPRRLMALAGVWVADANAASRTADETAAVAVPATRAAQGAKAVAHATFRIADAHVALPAACIGELLRGPRLRRELLTRDGVLGLCEWRGRLVPVVDLTGALQALPAGDDAAWICVVCEGELAIGIVVHEVLEIAKVAPDAGAPEHASASERSVVGRRLVTGGRTLQVIDGAALLRRYTEAAISVHGARAAELRTTADPTAPPYMVFDAGGRFAARIDGVQEVVDLPEDLRPRLEAGIATTLQWREQPVPVIAIADGLVALPARAARQLVIIRRGDRLAALPIAGVKALVPRGIACRNRMRMQGRSVEVISVETDDHRASYPVVDLVAALQPAA